MANQFYDVHRYYDSNIGSRRTLYHTDVSTSSPKVNGKLRLRANVHRWDHRRQVEFVYTPEFFFRGAPYDTQIMMMNSDLKSAVFDQTVNKALYRFTSKVRSNSSSLGVTLATAGQARDMIVDRAVKLNSIMDAKLSELTRKRSRRQRHNQIKNFAMGRASDYLEWVFGWLPLVHDIEDALGVLGDDFPTRYVSAKATATVVSSGSFTGSSYAYDSWIRTEFQIRCSISGFVSVSNPNLFLANRLGLLNIPGVAWDVIPWSFVVNMFTNMGQIVNSITDFVGLDMTDCSTTRSGIATRTHKCAAGSAPGQYPTQGYAQSVCTEVIKYRTLGTPVPTFQWRAKELDMGLASIAIALLVQKTNKLNALFS